MTEQQALEVAVARQVRYGRDVILGEVGECQHGPDTVATFGPRLCCCASRGREVEAAREEVLPGTQRREHRDVLEHSQIRDVVVRDINVNEISIFREKIYILEFVSGHVEVEESKLETHWMRTDVAQALLHVLE